MKSLPRTVSKATKERIKEMQATEGAAWALMLAEAVSQIKIMTTEVLEVVGQLNQHSERHAMQIRTIKKRLIDVQQHMKKLEERVAHLEQGRSRFEGI